MRYSVVVSTDKFYVSYPETAVWLMNVEICVSGDVDGLAQDCSNSIANALELLQSCTKPSMCGVNLGLVVRLFETYG